MSGVAATTTTRVNQSRRKQQVARILIASYTIGSIVAVISSLFGQHLEISEAMEATFALFNLPVADTVVSVVVMVLTTATLLRRKRIGLAVVALWQILGLYVGVAVLIRVSSWAYLEEWRAARSTWWVLDVVSIPIGIAILGLLWWVRSEFPGRLRPGSRPVAILVLLGGLLASVSVTWVLIQWTLPAERPSAPEDIIAILARAIGFTNPRLNRYLADLPAWLPLISSLLLGISISIAVLVFLRTSHDANAWSGEREVELRKLIRLHGRSDSLAYFASRRDRSVVFAEHHTAAVSYRVVNGVSLAAGDPVGDPVGWESAINKWQAEARQFGWIPAVLAASETAARHYRRAGLSVRYLGDEAIVDADHFGTDSAGTREVRRAAGHARRAGVRVNLRWQRDIEASELAELGRLASKWRVGDTERGFSMALGRLGDPADAGVLVATAQQEGRNVALLTFVPWEPGGASLDLMRHDPASPHGTIELVVTELLSRHRELGLHRVSLNFCMVRNVFATADNLGAGLWQRITAAVLGYLDRFWQLERLYVSNRRYAPQWRPRYLCYDGALSLPTVGVAIGIAEGFLPLRRRQRWTDASSQLRPEDLGRIRQLESEPVRLPPTPKVNKLMADRLAHLQELSQVNQGYPAASGRPVSAGLVSRGPWTPGSQVLVTGRLGRVRNHGGVLFAELVDSGSVQLQLQRDQVGVPALNEFAHLSDPGDILQVTGTLGHSRYGSPVVEVDSWLVVAKCLHPLPTTDWVDPEDRTRRRSLDLIVHPEQLAALRNRSAIVRTLRATLDQAGFLEVETPILQAVHGGATARPFRTTINTYGTDLYLRIAPELYLKRLIVGGLGPLYEIGRNFRNEGADATHNPEFTSLEAYQPFADYLTMKTLAEQLVQSAATAVHGSPQLQINGVLTDVSGPWRTMTVCEAVSQAVGEQIDLRTDRTRLASIARANGIVDQPGWGEGALIEELYSELVEPNTTQPTFYLNFPIETSPLTRPHRSEPGLVERWDLVVAGMELGTAYTELTDPIDQRNRLVEQSLKAANGDPEAMQVDEDFLAALECGMPPSGGLGLGLDRLVMLILGLPIRGTLTFPFVKPGSETRPSVLGGQR